MYPIFVIKFLGVLDLQVVKILVFPLTLLVIVTTVLRYRAAPVIAFCDCEATSIRSAILATACQAWLLVKNSTQP